MKVKRDTVERGIYIGLIVVLVIYGLKESEAAARLIEAVKSAFTILF